MHAADRLILRLFKAFELYTPKLLRVRATCTSKVCAQFGLAPSDQLNVGLIRKAIYPIFDPNAPIDGLKFQVNDCLRQHRARSSAERLIGDVDATLSKQVAGRLKSNFGYAKCSHSTRNFITTINIGVKKSHGSYTLEVTIPHVNNVAVKFDLILEDFDSRINCNLANFFGVQVFEIDGSATEQAELLFEQIESISNALLSIVDSEF